MLHLKLKITDWNLPKQAEQSLRGMSVLWMGLDTM